MIRVLTGLSNKLSQAPGNVFLLDGTGALLSAVLLVFLVAPFESFFGLSSKIAYYLSIPAFCFALYSLSCYFLHVRHWKPYMRLIAIANFVYCCVTFGLVVQQYRSLTVFGILYFLGELIIILSLIGIELKTIKENKYYK
jgi:hypothetical protein